MNEKTMWVPELVPLELIDSNPWQGRLEEDAVHVKTLAEDIAENTLLQPGLGRRVNGRVQLAFAHSRLAAFKFLDETFGARGNGQAGDTFTHFPVILRELTDRQMSDYAAIENAKRKDLTAIETAMAIQKRMADFGLTQLEAGRPFGYKNQASVAHLLRLLDLPEALKNLVAQRKLAERHARVLVPVARLSVENAVRIGKLIAEADPTESDHVADEALVDFVESEGRGMEAAYWPTDWKPDIIIDGEPAPACKGCPAFFKDRFMDNYCLRPECMDAKIQAWEEHELARLSEKLGIPIAAADDTRFKPLGLDYQNEEKTRNLLKRKVKPECLRLMAKHSQERGTWHTHGRVLDSKAVLLASSDPHVLNPKEDKPAPATSPGAPDEDPVIAAARARQAEKEREEREAEERRGERSALRRARADMTWLVFHTAEMLAPQMTIQPGGLLLDMLETHWMHTNNPSYEWPEYRERYETMEDAAEEAKLPLIRYQVMITRELGHRMSAYTAKEQFDWPQALEHVTELARDWGLKLPKGWNEPPIHKTDSNCHMCGTFTPGHTITAVDQTHGWQVEGEVVTCSEECRAQLTQSQVATVEVAKPKSRLEKKSQTKPKGKKR